MCKGYRKDTNFSSTEHFITAARWSKYHYGLGLTSAGLAVFAGGTVLTQTSELITLGGIFALISGAFAAVLTFLNPNERASCHLNAGNNYRMLRNKVRLLQRVGFLTYSAEQLQEKIEAYVTEEMP
jgi:hypothetical protein